jgi:heme-degrading monooxygenase HmoA
VIRTVLSMVVREGHEQEFTAAWRAAAERIARCPGNLGQSLARDEGQQRLFVIASEWDSREALREFERSPERVALSARLDPLRESASKAVQEVVVAVAAEPEGGYR